MAAPILAVKLTKNKTISNELFSSLTSYSGFSMSLNMNLRSELENFLIQYDRSNMAAPILAEMSTTNKTISNQLFSSLTSYSGVFDVAGHESEVRI